MIKVKRGRDAKTGLFITVEQAKRRKATAIVETVKTKLAKANKKKVSK